MKLTSIYFEDLDIDCGEILDGRRDILEKLDRVEDVTSAQDAVEGDTAGESEHLEELMLESEENESGER